MSGTIPRHILKPPPGTIREIDLIDWAPRAKAFAPEKLHRHQFYELLIITGSGGEHDLNFSSLPMKKYEIHFVGPDDVHLVFREKASSGCTLLFLPGVIDRPLLRSLPFGTERPVIQLPAAAFKRALIYLDLIRTETREQAAGNELVLRSLVQSLAIYLSRFWERDRPGAALRVEIRWSTASCSSCSDITRITSGWRIMRTCCTSARSTSSLFVGTYREYAAQHHSRPSCRGDQKAPVSY